jgi:hypothetical protein
MSSVRSFQENRNGSSFAKRWRGGRKLEMTLVADSFFHVRADDSEPLSDSVAGRLRHVMRVGFPGFLYCGTVVQ